MSRWLPVPVDAARSPAIAELSPPARLVWLALRIAHSEVGLGGTVPARNASASGLPLVAAALLVGVDTAACLAELQTAGLISSSDGGLVLKDFDREMELHPCSRCKCRNPDPRHSRCPRCVEQDRTAEHPEMTVRRTCAEPTVATRLRRKPPARRNSRDRTDAIPNVRRVCAEIPQTVQY